MNSSFSAGSGLPGSLGLRQATASSTYSDTPQHPLHLEPGTFGTPLFFKEKRSGLASHFDKYFAIEEASTPIQREEIYRLRYEVYCEDMGFENKEEFPDRMERDHFDNDAIHYLIRHRTSQKIAGCLRFILKRSHPASPLLPFELACGNLLDPDYYPPSPPQPLEYAEVSRIAAHPLFRKRTGEEKLVDGLSESLDYSTMTSSSRAFPIVAMALYLLSAALGVANNRQIYVMQEPKSARHLRRLGINVTQVSELVEFHGQRAAFTINPLTIPDTIKGEIRAFLLHLLDSLDS